MTEIKYNAFISYSHAIDGKFAPALQRGLQAVAKPWYKRRNLSVFRDKSDLSISPNLWASIIDGLSSSENLILLASQKSANSGWVAKEIEYWLENKSIDTIFIVVTDGELEWKGTDFNWSTTNNINPALKGIFKEEPHYLDFREIKKESDLSLNNPFFKDKVMSIAATLLQKKLSDLVGEDLKEHKKVKQIRNGVIALLLGLLLFAWYNFNQSVESRNAAIDAKLEAEIQRDSATLQKQIADSALIEANIQKDTALLERQKAIEALHEAQYQKNIARRETENAKRQKMIAEEERDIAESNKLAALSNNLKSSDPIQAIDLAKQAFRKTGVPTETASQALTSAFYELYESKLLPNSFEVDLKRSTKFGLFDKGQQVIYPNLKNPQGIYIQNIKNGELSLLHNRIEDFRILEDTKRIVLFQDQGSSSKSDTIHIYNFSGKLEKQLLLPHPLEELHTVFNQKTLLFTLTDNSLYTYDCEAEELNFISKVDNKYVLAGKGYSSDNKYISKDQSSFCYTHNKKTTFYSLNKKAINTFSFHPEMKIHGYYKDSLLLIEEEGFLKSVNYYNKKISFLRDGEVLNDERAEVIISKNGKFIVAGISSFFNPEETYERLLIWNENSDVLIEDIIPGATFQNIEISEDEKFLLFQTSNILKLSDGTAPWNNNTTTIYKLGNKILFNSELNSYLKEANSPKSKFISKDLIVHQVAPNKIELYNFMKNEIHSTITTKKEIEHVHFNKENNVLFVRDDVNESIFELNGNIILQVPSEQNEKLYGLVQNNTILYNSGKIWEINKITDPYKFSLGEQLRGYRFYKEEGLLVTFSRRKAVLWGLESKSIVSSFQLEELADGIVYIPNKNKFIVWGSDWIELRDLSGKILKHRKKQETGYTKVDDIISSASEDWFYSIHQWQGVLVWNINTLDPYAWVDIPKLWNYQKLGESFIADNVLFNSISLPIDTSIISEKNFYWERLAINSTEEIYLPEGEKIYKIKNGKRQLFFDLKTTNKIERVFNFKNKLFFSGYGFLGCIEKTNNNNNWLISLPKEITRELRYINDHVYISTKNVESPIRVFDGENGSELNIDISEIGFIKDLVISEEDNLLLSYCGYSPNKEFEFNSELMTIDYSLFIRSTLDNSILAKFNKIDSQIMYADFLPSNEAFFITKNGNLFYIPLAKKILSLTF